MKCDSNKVALQLYLNYASSWVFSCEFTANFQNTFQRNNSGGLLMEHIFSKNNSQWLLSKLKERTNK